MASQPMKRESNLREGEILRSTEKNLRKDEVLLILGEPSGAHVRCRIVEESAARLQILHDYRRLRSGQVVRFKTRQAEGVAVVLWTRVEQRGSECVLTQLATATSPVSRIM